MYNLKKILLVTVPLTLVILLSFAFQWPVDNGYGQLGPKLLLSAPNSNNEYQISFDPASLPAPLTANGYSNWRVFLNLDNGVYWSGSYLELSSQYFTFGSNRTHQIYAELTPTYDDGGTSPGIAKLSIPNSSGSGSGSGSGSLQTNSNWVNQIVSLPAGKIVTLNSSRSPKFEDIITYIITVQNNTPSGQNLTGTLTFTFDNVIDAQNYETNTSKGGSLSQTPITSGSGPLTISVASLTPGEQRNYFIHCITKSADPDGTYQIPTVNFTGAIRNKDNTETAINDSDAMYGQVIVDNHDPNHKFAAEQTLCMDADSVTFTISFQNDGAGPVHDIVVNDPMDYLLLKAAPNLISWSSNSKPVLDASAINNGIIKYTFSHINLPGLYDPDLLTNGKNENDTQVTFTFRCALDHDKTSQFPCSIVMNQAYVYFDCNPPVKTNLAVSHLQCTSCTSCTAIPDTSFVVDSIPTVDSLISATSWGGFLLNQLSSDPSAEFKWYPPNSFEQATSSLPKWNYTSVDPEAYLVISGTCHYQIVKFDMPTGCNLDIQLDLSHLIIDPCNKQISGYITASAIGTNSNAVDLQWQTCFQTGYSYQMNVDNKVLKYHFGLTDKKTGCYVEKTYTVKFPRCALGPSTGLLFGMLALVVIIGGLLYYVFKSH